MSERRGFHYYVSDHQLEVFRSRTPAERLKWLEETRELTWQLASEETKRWWKKLRA